MRLGLAVMLAGCASHAAAPGTAVTLRPACGPSQYWNGTACTAASDAPKQIAAAVQAIVDLKVDDAKAALDAAEKAEPLDHGSYVTLWEQRGILDAYLDDPAAATTAFDMLLALDPGHFLSYTLSPKATFLFEQLRKQKDRATPAVDVTWARGGKVGDPVPVDIDVLADPKGFLHRATVFVRTRGETAWHAADIALHGKGEQHIVLPAIAAQKPVSLEIYASAYDDKNNEVLTWSDATRPREIPLRYDPPTPWYRRWWAITIASSVVAVGTGVTVYELTLAAPDKINGSASIAK